MEAELGALMREEFEKGLFLVHRSAFVSPEILEAEMTKIFQRCWIFVGHAAELKQPGDFVTRTVVGRPLIFCCDDDGQIQVLFNTCTHQGTVVCREARGRTSTFQCFNHAWTFNNRGGLIGIPGRDGYTDAWIKGELDLHRPARVSEYRGFVFMNLDPQCEPLEDYLAGAREYLDLVVDQMTEGVDVIRGQQKYAVRANWKLLATNSLDQYHVGPTHQTYFDYLKDIGADVSGGAQAARGRAVNLGNGHAAIEFGGAWGRPGGQWVPFFGEETREEIASIRRRLEGRYGPERAHRMTDVNRNLLVFPNLIVADLFAVQIRTFYPVSPGYMDVTLTALAPTNDSPALRAIRLDNYLSFWGPAGLATPDDVEAFVLQQRGFEDAEVEWTDVSKGMRRETTEFQEPYTDELQLRVFWRQWGRLMSAS